MSDEISGNDHTTTGAAEAVYCVAEIESYSGSGSSCFAEYGVESDDYGYDVWTVTVDLFSCKRDEVINAKYIDTQDSESPDDQLIREDLTWLYSEHNSRGRSKPSGKEGYAQYVDDIVELTLSSRSHCFGATADWHLIDEAETVVRRQARADGHDPGLAVRSYLSL